MQEKKRYVLPEFTEPHVSALSPGAPTAGQGCRLEPNSLYVRFWKSGSLGSGTTVTAAFAFAASAQSWTAAGTTRWTGSWDSGHGNPAGCLTSTLAVDSRNRPGTGTFSWVGTWEQLGVPTSKTITGVQLVGAYDYCPALNATADMGPYTIYDSANTTLVATLAAARNITVPDSTWVSRSGTTQTVASTYQPSSTTITLRVVTDGDCDSVSNLFIYVDQLAYAITYT